MCEPEPEPYPKAEVEESDLREEERERWVREWEVYHEVNLIDDLERYW